MISAKILVYRDKGGKPLEFPLPIIIDYCYYYYCQRWGLRHWKWADGINILKLECLKLHIPFRLNV